MKTKSSLVLSSLVAAAALALLLASPAVAVSVIAAGGVLTIAFADYRHEIKSLGAPMANMAAFRSPDELALAA